MGDLQGDADHTAVAMGDHRRLVVRGLRQLLRPASPRVCANGASASGPRFRASAGLASAPYSATKPPVLHLGSPRPH